MQGAASAMKDSELSFCNSKEDLKVNPSDFIFMRADKFLDHYTLLEKLGEGAYGMVSKCENKHTGELRAVKQLKKIRF